MFFCEKCRLKNDWPSSMTMSYGRCEICGTEIACNDVASKHLPPPKRQKVDEEVSIKHVSPGSRELMSPVTGMPDPSRRRVGIDYPKDVTDKADTVLSSTRHIANEVVDVAFAAAGGTVDKTPLTWLRMQIALDKVEPMLVKDRNLHHDLEKARTYSDRMRRIINVCSDATARHDLLLILDDLNESIKG